MSVDKQRMIDTAVAYFLAGERCNPDFGFGQYPTHRVDAPTIACYALAVEISLKLLLLMLGLIEIQSKEIRTHDLKNFYDKIPDSNKVYLTYFEDLFCDYDFGKREPGEYSEDDCEDDFSGYGNQPQKIRLTEYIPFVDWRYPYEHARLEGETNKLRRCFIQIHQEIRRIDPGLMSTYERDWGRFEPDWLLAWPEEEPKNDGSAP